MYHITTPTATSEHEFTDGDGVIPATDLNALWYNMIQRELLAVLAGVGITPNASDFKQVWQSISKVGIKNLYSSDSTVDVSNFAGSTIIFHTAADFAVSGTINKYALLVVVPTWGDNSPSYIDFTYGGSSKRIYKNNIFVGFAYNETALKFYGVTIPILNAHNALTVQSIQYSGVIDNGVVYFENSDEVDESGVEKFRSWELADNWSVGRVKKVVCTNAAESGSQIPIFYDAESSWKNVKFYPYGYREFLCVGTRVSGEKTYAVLKVNGIA